MILLDWANMLVPQDNNFYLQEPASGYSGEVSRGGSVAVAVAVAVVVRFFQ